VVKIGIYSLVRKAKKILEYVEQVGYGRKGSYFTIRFPNESEVNVIIETSDGITTLKSCTCKFHSAFKGSNLMSSALCQYYLAVLFKLEQVIE
jgi:hypothetical protein